LYFRPGHGWIHHNFARGLQAFTVIPLMVYRIYPDGPRGIDSRRGHRGDAARELRENLATSDRMEVFNGFCGAESGDVPVSAISPAILVSEIEIQRKEKSTDLKPYLPRPEGTK
jgi:hypothetical protein